MRLVWRLGVPHQNPDPSYSGPALPDPPLAVLGMHRSGTSAVAGMLEDQGFSTGIAHRGRLADNPRGTRENQDLVRLDDAVLQLNGYEWDRPPTDIDLRFTAHYVRRRDRFVADMGSCPAILKDPRMVLLRQLWNGVPLRPIGVIRNPLAVSVSLRRREPQRTEDECLRIWSTYNGHLLRWLEAEPFPVIEFGGENDLEAELALALEYYGLPVSHAFRFFDAEFIRSDQRGVKWRQEVPEGLTQLWDEILSRAIVPTPLSSGAAEDG